MLGVVATTFFAFGLMVGNLTSGSQADDEAPFDTRVTGQVLYDNGRAMAPDNGAVVLLLPKEKKPMERAAGNSVYPEDFEPLDNPGVEIVNGLGGAVVRTDDIGRYDVLVDGRQSGIEYWVLIVSRHQADDDPEPLDKLQTAAIGTFYMPVERVINDRAFYWSSLTADRESVELGTVEF